MAALGDIDTRSVKHLRHHAPGVDPASMKQPQQQDSHLEKKFCDITTTASDLFCQAQHYASTLYKYTLSSAARAYSVLKNDHHASADAAKCCSASSVGGTK